MTFAALEAKADRAFPHITAARDHTRATLEQLGGLLQDRVPADTSAVVFGSLARGESTEKSDVDWTLLIDGRADPGHHDAVRGITRALAGAGFAEPGPTGIFGNVAVSHDLVHQIGGQEDTNKLTTQRILLLLESRAIGPAEALDRVLHMVLSRYVRDDRGLLYGSKGALVPRFLLNDLVRYWRTVTVDFVYKQRDRDRGWALRNAKLKMSRKLIFVAGMLSCFAPELEGVADGFRGPSGRPDVDRLLPYLRDRLRTPPLEQLAQAALRPAVRPETARALFEEYDAFLGVLRDEGKRGRLKGLTVDELDGDPAFREAMGIGRRFQQALDRLFFEEDAELRKLVLEYGVF